jgi:hypothetical protein
MAPSTRPKQIEKMVLGMSSPPRPTKVAKGQQHQREDLGRAEGERHVGQQRREGGEEDVGDRAAHERGQRRRDQREARTALPARGRPSNVVATAVEAPGMPSVTDEIAPPYIAP